MTAPLAIVNGKPLKLSWTRIRSHAECPQQGHLKSQGKRSPTADIRGYFHGTVVDRAYRDWLNMDTQPDGWMAQNVRDILDREEKMAKANGDGIVKWRTPTDKAEITQFCLDTVVKLERISQDLVLPYEWQPDVWFEVPIEVPGLDGNLTQVLLIGAMDLLVRRPEGVEIWDLKATRDNNYWRKVTGQLLFYEICWWGKHGDWPVRTGLIQPMCTPEVLPIPMDDALRRQMFGSICNTAMDIMRGAVAPKPESGVCYNCPVKHACPVFAPPAGRGNHVNMAEVVTA